jgi:hypothetical protein
MGTTEPIHIVVSAVLTGLPCYALLVSPTVNCWANVNCPYQDKVCAMFPLKSVPFGPGGCLCGNGIPRFASETTPSRINLRDES